MYAHKSLVDGNHVYKTQLDKVPELIEPLMSSETRLLMIMNGLIEDDLIDMLKKQREAKGLEGVGCKAIYGEIHHASFLFQL